MNERPILFSAAMVRAILAGEKTQTRRALTPQPDLVGARGAEVKAAVLPQDKTRTRRGGLALDPWAEAVFTRKDGEIVARYGCPYGVPGDRLWVKETFWVEGDDQAVCFYAATDPRSSSHLKPSIFMPRSLSRILLEVKSVRVERVQDISEEDARAEGCGTASVLDDEVDPPAIRKGPFSCGFCKTWDSINAKRGFGWDTNPWVWVIEFKRIDGKEGER
jgi:hypothetical protein